MCQWGNIAKGENRNFIAGVTKSPADMSHMLMPEKSIDEIKSLFHDL